MTTLTPSSETGAAPVLESLWEQKHWVVPRADRALLISPELPEAAELLLKNRALFQSVETTLLGRSFAELRQAARRTALQAAHAYTSQWVNLSSCAACSDFDSLSQAPLVLSGHQPQLFHVGVWFKNFVAGRLARESQGVGLNLVVESDMCSSTALRLPAPPHGKPTFATCEFDTRRSQRPWEEMHLQDRELFRTFPQRVAQALAPWGFSPLLESLWPDALKLSQRTDRLADLLTAARNSLERRWGNRNLELPISSLCQTEPFLWFLLTILNELPRFQQTYNDILAEYRRVNHLRSQTHPVPGLRQLGERIEAPFRVWLPGETRRRPLFAQRQGAEIILSDETDELLRLQFPVNGDPRPAIEQLQAWQKSGVRLRTRALTTTLYSRLFLGDLFLHGIGGSKYDEMTDRLIARFFHISAPGYVTLSASLFLPLNPFPVTPRDAEHFAREEHLLHWSPEQCEIASSAGLEPELLQKLQSLKSELDSLQRDPHSARHKLRRRELHRELHELRALITPRVKAEFDRSERPRWEEVTRQLQANEVLANREWSFALFPEQLLHDFLHSQGLI
ncbi:MAG: hypothetical protein U0903_14900 [Planctomycetales bacterium]